MNDEEALVMLITLCWALAGYALYLRLFVVRRLRKRIDRLVDTALAPRPAEPVAIAPKNQDEFATIHKRLQVLERIAVEKEDTLVREIEDLRSIRA